MSQEKFEELRTAIIEGDDEETLRIAEDLMEEEAATLREAVNVAIQSIRFVGDQFGEGEVFLPEMVLSAEAMQAFMNQIAPKLEELTGEARVTGKVALSTVKGDIHSIGKDIVATMLNASGIDVLDLGVDTSPMEVIQSAENAGAKIIGLSALMTTSMPYQKEVVELLNELNLRDKFWVILGGGPVTPDYAQNIGANGWAANAAGAVRLCERMFASQEKPSTAEFMTEER